MQAKYEWLWIYSVKHEFITVEDIYPYYMNQYKTELLYD